MQRNEMFALKEHSVWQVLVCVRARMRVCIFCGDPSSLERIALRVCRWFYGSLCRSLFLECAFCLHYYDGYGKCVLCITQLTHFRMRAVIVGFSFSLIRLTPNAVCFVRTFSSTLCCECEWSSKNFPEPKRTRVNNMHCATLATW